MQAVLVVLALLLCCHAAAAKKLPNIVFVLADDLGHADIGYHGGAGQGIKTSVLDKLAQEGMRLENYYVQPICTPTRGTLMSGRIPIHTGLQHMVITPAQPYGLPLNLTTLPQQLKKQGYSTHMVGKWHLGMYEKAYLPTSRGFDTYYGYYQGAEDYFNHTVCGGGRGPFAKQYCGVDLHNDTTPDFSRTGQYSTHLFANEAVRLINKQKDSSAPMFMYLPFQNVHAPQEAPESYIDQYPSIQNLQRRTLAAQITVLDEAVGNVTNALKSAGMWNNTVFIFSSDNGGPTQAMRSVGCNYPLRGMKATLWEGGTKVAGFISGPLAPGKPGSVYNGLMHISDWYPTILGLAGVANLPGVTLDGFNQWSALSKSGASPRTEMLYNIDPLSIKYGFKKQGSPFDNRLQAALRVGDMKILTGITFGDGWYKPVSVQGEVQKSQMIENERIATYVLGLDKSILQNIFLFNITADPNERQDLSQEQPDMVDTMLEKLAVYYKGMVPALNPASDIKDADPAKHGGSWEPWM